VIQVTPETRIKRWFGRDPEYCTSVCDPEHSQRAEIELTMVPTRDQTRGARVMFDSSAMSRAAMSPESLAALGENRLAYIRAIRSEEVAFLCADAPLLPPGHRVFVLHAADGTPILLADSREAALADAESQQIETVSLH